MDSPSIAGTPLVCSHCNGIAFSHRRAQLNTALASFFGVDGLNQSASVYACRRCGRLEWFLQPDTDYIAESAPTLEGAPAIECPECNMIVGAGKRVCRICGWSRG